LNVFNCYKHFQMEYNCKFGQNRATITPVL
jgi:hypothetical protein